MFVNEPFVNETITFEVKRIRKWEWTVREESIVRWERAIYKEESETQTAELKSTQMALNRWPLSQIRPAGRLFVIPKLLFLHYVFWLGQHVYTGTCLHANDTQTACYWVTHCCKRNFLFSLLFMEQLAYWHFAGCRSLDCTKMAYSKFTAKGKVDSETGPTDVSPCICCHTKNVPWVSVATPWKIPQAAHSQWQ